MGYRVLVICSHVSVPATPVISHCQVYDFHEATDAVRKTEIEVIIGVRASRCCIALIQNVPGEFIGGPLLWSDRKLPEYGDSTFDQVRTLALANRARWKAPECEE